MTKSELIQYLRAYDNAEKAASKAYEEEQHAKGAVTNCKRPPKLNSTTFGGAFIACFLLLEIPIAIVVLIVLFIYIAINLPPNNDWLHFPIPIVQSIAETVVGIGGLFEYLIFALPVISLIVALIPDIIISIPVAKLTLSSDKRANENAHKQYEQRQKELPNLELQLQKAVAKANAANQYLQALQNRNIVHPNYLPYVSTLAKYLETGRADNLKEAINLLENELRENERDRELYIHHQEMQRMAAEHAAIMEAEASREADAAERAAHSADEAAFWGAFATYEAGKIREKLDK